ncbi:MAG: RNA-processing protein [Methanocalculus sp. MSAO_Arc1]|uniref:KH domain-containing protein n=1 Tax=Methanocalculus TaxID=71151 RepID=UPI000FF3C072|nr:MULTISPECIES: KH domain-containing protein [unclassified Methanocalculus]MCP1661649.1 ribosomal RNA assembly protein [Methanocalculus sp. AMF5]RQD81912.1 MAG: RNA-processing protein [Methanocalculus sp. MSAO_Arc1]
MTIQELKVAADRIGVIIGKGGATRKAIEEQSGAEIQVDSAEGVVTVDGEDAVGVLRATEVIRALGRGFSPERAFRLFEDEDIILDILDLSNVADTPQKMNRLRGRIIGRDGKARDQIESMTGTAVSIYGKTVGIIGLPEPVQTSRKAIEMLVEGADHASVFGFLDKRKKEAKQDLIGYYY